MRDPLLPFCRNSPSEGYKFGATVDGLYASIMTRALVQTWGLRGSSPGSANDSFGVSRDGGAAASDCPPQVDFLRQRMSLIESRTAIRDRRNRGASHPLAWS
jgi:hypothetical protein